MNESRDIFIRRIDTTHIQRDEMNEFRKLCQEGKAFSGIGKDEFERLLNDLDNDSVKHSNDMVIDMIINYVKEYTNDADLKTILENINIGNILNDNSLMGRAYVKYYDGSYYIEIARNIEKKMMILADLFAVLFMYNEDIKLIERLLLDKLLNANLQRFNGGEEFNESFNAVQMNMISFDKLQGNDDFTNNYVAYSREIFEIAMAILIGHEVGHHYFGHTDENIKSNEDAKIKEFKADCYGIDFAIDYLQSAYANDKNVYGIHQFSGMYLPLIVSSYFCDDIFADEEKHPSIVKRFNIVQKKLESRIDKETYQEVKKYICKLFKIIKFEKCILI